MKEDLDKKIGKWFWKNREHRIRLAALEGIGSTIIFILLPAQSQGIVQYTWIASCYLFTFCFMYYINKNIFKKYKNGGA